jgi:hypothetical protein
MPPLRGRQGPKKRLSNYITHLEVMFESVLYRKTGPNGGCPCRSLSFTHTTP